MKSIYINGHFLATVPDDTGYRVSIDGKFVGYLGSMDVDLAVAAAFKE